MFTGIVESTGRVIAVHEEGTNRTFSLEAELGHELKIDQSLSHDGVCLTVTGIDENTYKVTAVEETLKKTNLKSWNAGTLVNLERCMPANGRFDGHIVQGHVDQTGQCSAITEREGSWLFDFDFDTVHGNVTVEKGSICINGVSLTVFDSKEGKFRVAIIPYTYHHTNFSTLRVGDRVNLEFDILGKYIKRIMKGYPQ